jgi:hypothetical protein
MTWCALWSQVNSRPKQQTSNVQCADAHLGLTLAGALASLLALAPASLLALSLVEALTPLSLINANALAVARNVNR